MSTALMEKGQTLGLKDEAQGVVTIIANATNIKDDVDDVVMPGAFRESLRTRKPKIILGHDWKQSIAKVISYKEYEPGDPELLKVLREAEFPVTDWPDEAGALIVEIQFNMRTERGREAFEDVRFYGAEAEWSIGYKVPNGGAYRARGVRYIKALILYEISLVLHGANRWSKTLSVKDVSTGSAPAASTRGFGHAIGLPKVAVRKRGARWSLVATDTDTDLRFFDEEEDAYDALTRVLPGSHGTFTIADRARMFDKGVALDDGAMPVITRDDLITAVAIAEYSKDPIIREFVSTRADVLDARALLPWGEIKHGGPGVHDNGTPQAVHAVGGRGWRKRWSMDDAVRAQVSAATDLPGYSGLPVDPAPHGGRGFEIADPTFDPSAVSELHLNLHRPADKMMSVRQGGKVKAYTSDAVLREATLPVGKGGWQRASTAAQEGRSDKTPHAFVRGTFDPGEAVPADIPDGWDAVAYNPAKAGSPNFWWASDGETIPTDQVFPKIIIRDWRVYAPRTLEAKMADWTDDPFTDDDLWGVKVEDEEGIETKRDYSRAQREEMAARGQALDDGSFPIKDREDLKNAVSLLHFAKDRAKALAHIMKRARALGAMDLVTSIKAAPLGDEEDDDPGYTAAVTEEIDDEAPEPSAEEPDDDEEEEEEEETKAADDHDDDDEEPEPEPEPEPEDGEEDGEEEKSLLTEEDLLLYEQARVLAPDGVDVKHDAPWTPEYHPGKHTDPRFKKPKGDKRKAKSPRASGAPPKKDKPASEAPPKKKLNVNLPSVSESMERAKPLRLSSDDLPDHLSKKRRRTEIRRLEATTGTGTKDDPVKTQSVFAAAKALGEGKHVQLSQPREVSTLLEELRAITAEAKAKGADAPTFDLCKITVPGTNLFCAESKGISRVQMPQLSGVPKKGSKADALEKDSSGEVSIMDKFRDSLIKRGIAIDDVEVPAANLRASQNELNGAKVAGISKGMAEGKIPDARLFVSKDDYVVDGHHRWAAKVGLDVEDDVLGDIEMPVARIDMDIIELLDEANKFAAEWGMPQAAVGQMQTKVAEGGADRNRGQAEHLRRYWVRGEGAAKIRWGVADDFYRCVKHLSKYMIPERAKGYCALRHKDATGFWPGKGPHAGKSAEFDPETELVPPSTETDYSGEDLDMIIRMAEQMQAEGDNWDPPEIQVKDIGIGGDDLDPDMTAAMAANALRELRGDAVSADDVERVRYGVKVLAESLEADDEVHISAHLLPEEAGAFVAMMVKDARGDAIERDDVEAVRDAITILTGAVEEILFPDHAV